MFEQLDFFFGARRASRPEPELLSIGFRTVALRLVRNSAARRYILRVDRDGSARVTIPRGGSFKAGREFAQRHRAWIEKQLQKKERKPEPPASWTHGTEILFRGEKTPLVVGLSGQTVHLAEERIRLQEPGGDLRPAIERHLRALAVRELVPRVRELAALQQVEPGSIIVRDQRSRWGSCSVKKTISLNWRLVQTPPFVRDYIIWHELMHLREMNHSRRFWRHVGRVCPDYVEAEKWLKQHESLLKPPLRN